MKKLLALILAMLLLVSALAGCGNNTEKPDNSGAPGNSGAPNSPSESNPPAQAPEAWTEADATETLVIHTASATHFLVSYTATGGDQASTVNYLRTDPLIMKGEDGSLNPWIAESWELAEDGMSVSFKIRDDVYFTNGTNLTAEDIVYTFEQIRDDSEHFPDSPAKPWRNYLGELTVDDTYAFTMNFKQPYPEFWSQITGFIQWRDKALSEEIGFDAYFDNYVGTGPYILTKADYAAATYELELRTDEHGYWGYDYEDTYTNVKKIIVANSPESQTRTASLRAGEVQVIDYVPTTDKALLEGEGLIVTPLNPTQSVFLEFNCRPGTAFADQKLREAFSLAIDREAIVTALLDGFAMASTYPCKPGDLGYRDNIKAEYDTERAKQLVQESGYNGEELRFIYTTSTVSIANELCQAIQQMCQAVGINIKLEPMDVAVFDTERLEANCDVCLSAIVISGNMWYKTAAEIIGQDRFNSGFVNEELLALGVQMQTTTDPDKQDEILARMYEIQLTDFQPLVYLYYPQLMCGTAGNVSGIRVHGGYFLDCSHVVIG